MTTTELKPPATDARYYPLSRDHLVLGIVGTTLIAVCGIISFAVTLRKFDGDFLHPNLDAALYFCFWSGWAVIAVWIVLASLRECLVLSDTQVVWHGLIRSRAIKVSEVVHVNWGDRIVVRTPTKEITFRLDSYPRERRAEIVRYFRETFPADIQAGWSWRLDDFLHLPPPPPERMTSRVGIIVTSAVSLTLAGLYVYFWHTFRAVGDEYLLIGLVVGIAAIRYLRTLRTFTKQGADRSVTRSRT